MSACRSCGAPILWTVTPKGRRMPVDAHPTDDGNLVLADSPTPGQPPTAYAAPVGQLLLGGAADRADRYVSHFATCPFADQHRKGNTT